MCVSELFDHWRKTMNPNQSWGLAWFLANEFCKRYYSSHGIAPIVNVHDGLGYYGILIMSVPCKINRKGITYGRMTAGGNVENWQNGSPGDHGLCTMEMCAKDISTEEIVQKAITHMRIEPIPPLSHGACRHKLWGKSYELCFEIATIVALRNNLNAIEIWNHPNQTMSMVSVIDPKSDMKEHLGAFLFCRNDKKLLLAADGRLLDISGQDLWLSFMNGCSPSYLARMIEERMGV